MFSKMDSKIKNLALYMKAVMKKFFIAETEISPFCFFLAAYKKTVFQKKKNDRQNCRILDEFS